MRGKPKKKKKSTKPPKMTHGKWLGDTYIKKERSIIYKYNILIIVGSSDSES